MDLLQRAFQEALDRNAAEVIRWTEYKQLHEAARRNLLEFQKSLEIEIMVPVGTKALIPGRLHHTNEILVSHSGTYYSKCSVHKALEICQHRLDIAAKRLEDLKTEAEMYRNKLDLPIHNDAFSSNDAEEIIEPYDEEVDKKWRDEHKKKMKKHKQKEAEERRKLHHAHVKDDIIEKLDELELMEELENELAAMQLGSLDDDSLRAFLDKNEHLSSSKTRISHLNNKNSQVQILRRNSDGSSRETETISSGNGTEDGDSHYDEQKKQMKDHKQKEAEKRAKLHHENVTDDIIEQHDEENLMAKFLASDLIKFDDDTLRAFFDKNEQSSSSEERISHLNDKNCEVQELPSSCDGSSLKIESLSSGDDNDDDDSDYDDIPIEFTEIEHEAKALTKPEQIKFYKTKLAEVQQYLQNFRPTNMEEISVKTDKMFFSDYLLDIIETLEDELNCDKYLNGENVMRSEKSSTTKPTTTVTPKTSIKPILKKRGSKNDQERRISFALEDDIKSFDGSQEPSKISTTIQFEHGPVLKININHSEKKFTETPGDSDVIRNPADIYKHFAECKLIKKNEPDKPVKTILKDYLSKIEKKHPSYQSGNQTPESKQAQEADADITEAKEEVKEMLNDMFRTNISNAPDPLPQGNFVDSHAPKKRISLFKSSRMMKNK